MCKHGKTPGNIDIFTLKIGGHKHIFTRRNGCCGTLSKSGSVGVGMPNRDLVRALPRLLVLRVRRRDAPLRLVESGALQMFIPP